MQYGWRAVLAPALAWLAVWMLVATARAPVYGLATANADDEIVYLDPGGVIRVVDPRPSSTQLEVQWASPDGGWTAFALGDFNADGDEEIAAIRTEAGAGRLTVFDPVLLDVPEGHLKFIGGVAWDILYSTEFDGRPRVLTSGDFDPARPGAELLYSVAPIREDNEDGTPVRVTVLRNAGETSTGRTWEVMATYASDFNWTWAASGNADGAGGDEAALVDSGKGNLAVFRVTTTLAPFFSNRNKGLTWQQAALGQFVADGPAELAAVRDGELPANSFWVFAYENNTMVDLRGEAFLPSPYVVFFADLTGNGDEEVIMLRSVRQEVTARPRLIIRDNGNESPGLRDALLDGDNGYQSGASGDIDGDKPDEIALMRDSRIRIYTEPEKSARFEEIVTPTDSLNIHLGNLDANGLAGVSTLGANVDAVALTLRVGQNSESAVVRVSDITNAETLAVTARTEQGSAWVEVTPVGGQTPLSLTVTLDSSGLQPGVYRDRILVDAQQGGVARDPLAIPVALTVESGVTTVPELLLFYYFPCDEAVAVKSLPLAVEPPDGQSVNYTVAVAGNPDWIEADPGKSQLPDIVTVTVDPTRRPADSVRVDLLLTLDLPGAPGTVQRVPVALVCARAELHAPFIAAGGQ